LGLGNLIEIDVGGGEHFLDVNAGELLQRQGVGMSMQTAVVVGVSFACEHAPQDGWLGLSQNFALEHAYKVTHC
jgi:hypothetical protein